MDNGNLHVWFGVNLGVGGTLVLIAGTIGLWCCALALIGYVDRSTARCRRCRADVRSRGWDDEPTCACGAALDRPGAIHSRRRVGRKTLLVGVALVAVAVAAIIEDGRLRKRELLWPDLVPESMLVSRYQSGEKQATESFQRRLAAGTLGIVGARTWIEQSLALDSSGHALLGSDEFAALTRAVRGDTALCERLVTLNFTPAIRVKPEEHALLLTMAASDWYRMARVEQVRLEGRPVTWTLDPRNRMLGNEHWCTGAESTLNVEELTAGAKRIEVDLVVMFGKQPLTYMTLGNDALLMTAPPEQWGIDVAFARITCAIDLRGATP